MQHIMRVCQRQLSYFSKFEMHSFIHPKVGQGFQNLKKKDHMMLTTPLSGLFVIRRLGLAVVNIPTEFKVS